MNGGEVLEQKRSVGQNLGDTIRMDLTRFLRAASPREYSVANPSNSDSN